MIRPSLDRLHYAVIVHSLTPSSLISPVLGLPPLSPLYDINRLVHSGGLTPDADICTIGYDIDPIVGVLRLASRQRGE
jgi:hypothetical protein